MTAEAARRAWLILHQRGHVRCRDRDDATLAVGRPGTGVALRYVLRSGHWTAHERHGEGWQEAGHGVGLYAAGRRLGIPPGEVASAIADATP